MPSTSSAPAPTTNASQEVNITLKNSELKGKLAVMHRRTRALETVLRSLLRAVGSIEDPAVVHAAEAARSILNPYG